MKFNKLLFGLLALAAIATGCTPISSESTNNPSNNPSGDTSTTNPAEEYVRLNLFSGCGYNDASEDAEIVTRTAWEDAMGSGNLSLKWESVDIDSDKTNELSLIISNGETPLFGKLEEQIGTSFYEDSYSGLSVTPHEEDAHHADFQTVYYYAIEELKSAAYCYAVVGDAQISEDADNSQHICYLEMPAKFTQTTSQDPSFLRNNMYMYSATAYKENRTTLNFDHIPATFRFIISNTTAEAVALQEVSVSMAAQADDAKVASKSSELTFDWTDETAALSFDENGHDKVAVAFANDTSLASGETYTAYAMVLPLPNDDAFQGKALNISIKSNDKEQVAFQLEGAKLAEINGSDIYNWVSGKSYTVRINIREDGKATGEILEGNRIEVVPSATGRYSLMYEGADGLVLNEYAPICTLPIKEMAYYEDFIDANIAPREARTIGVYDDKGNRQGTIQLSNFRPTMPSNPCIVSVCCRTCTSDARVSTPRPTSRRH